MKLKQKKFYSSDEVNAIVEKAGKRNGQGYSETLRELILEWGKQQSDYGADHINWLKSRGLE